MILSLLLSATFTFTVTATGVEKGTAVEFFFAGPNTDRAYESMFVLDEPIDALCSRIEKSVPLGQSVDATKCSLWPTGCHVRFDPPLERFVTAERPEGARSPVPVFTGGTRSKSGSLEAVDTMPAAFFSTYSLDQSPIVFDEPFDQGAVYGQFKAATKLEKGQKLTFNLSIDEKTLPKKLSLTAEKGKLVDLIQRLRSEAADGEIDVTVSFSDLLSIDEATSVAQALSVLDSTNVKINGKSNIFYRAFLPLEKWRDRQERLHQPFELTLRNDGTDELLFIEEDWTVDGNDPKLTPKKITPADTVRYPQTDTCFVYVSKNQTVARLVKAIGQLKSDCIVNVYVFLNE